MSKGYTILKKGLYFKLKFIDLQQTIQNIKIMKDVQTEIVPIVDEDLFIVLNHPDADFNYSVHYHPEYEINLVMNTYGERIVGDSIEPFKDMDLVMIGPNLAHKWCGRIVEGNHVITIQFSEQFTNLPILNKRLFTPIKKLLSDAQRGICFSHEAQLKLKDKIIELTRMQGFQTVLAFLSLLYELSISDRYTLTSNRYDIKDTILSSKSRRIAKVCSYIEEHFYGDISLSGAASLIGMTDSAFSHFFKSKTNTTFIDYLNNLRIAKACQLLTETDQTVTEICYNSGFNNMSNFIRMFKKKKQYTPNEYRVFMGQILLKY